MYLCDVWLVYPIKIGGEETQANKIIASLKKLIYKGNKPAKIASIAQLFRLLDHFTTTKNAYAPAVYKVLISTMVDHFNNSELRELFLHNFRAVFKSSGESIPIGVVLEPLLKYLQSPEAISAKKLNIFDLEFLACVAQSPKLSTKHVIPLLDVLAKVYLNNIIYSSIVGKSIIRLVATHLEFEQIQDFVTKLVEVSLAIFYSSEKSKRPKERILPNYNNKHVNSRPIIPNQELEQEILGAQKRALIIELIKNLINLGNHGLNDQIKSRLLLMHQQLDSNLKSEHKGILMLISLYGEPNKVIAQFDRKKRGNDRKEIRKSLSPLPIKKAEEQKSSDFLKTPVTEGGYDFFKELGLAPKVRVTRPEKPKATTDLSFLRSPKADPRVLKKIEEIQKSFTDKSLKLKETPEVDRSFGGFRARRLSEVGVPFTNKHYTPESFLFDESSQEAEKMLEKRQLLTSMTVIHLDKEEERESKCVKIVMKKYSKAIKSLFSMYAHSGNAIKEAQVVQSKFEVSEPQISLAEMWKLMKDYDFGTLISYEELAALLRLTNVEIMKDTNLKLMTFEGFKNLLIQLAIFIYSRSTEDIAQQPSFVQVKEFILKCREVDAKNGRNTIFYDDPDRTNPGDPELNKHLNQLLKEDPNHEIPDVKLEFHSFTDSSS